MDIKARWSRLRRTPIGLDVGSRLIKAVQLAPAPGTASGMRVAAAVVVPRSALLPSEGGPAGAAGGANASSHANGGKPFAGAPALPTAQELAGLPEVLDRAGFSGRRVVLAAPSAGLMTSVLELPARAGAAPARQIARMELARANRCPPDSFEMGFWDLPSPGAGVTMGSGRAQTRGGSVMAVGLPHAQANALLDGFEAAGLYVSAIDVGACALVRACEPLIKGTAAAATATASAGASAAAGGAVSAAERPEQDTGAARTPPSKMMAILDLGWETAMLWLVYGGSIIYGRPLADGGVGRLHESLVTRHGLEPDVADYLLTEVGLSDKHHADAAAAADADEDREHEQAGGNRPRPARSDRPPLPDHEARAILVTYADEMVRELSVSFAYAAHEYQDGEVGRLLMVGGGGAMPGLAGRLTDALGVAATPVAPAELAGCDPDLLVACGSPALTAAAGLALFPEAR